MSKLQDELGKAKPLKVLIVGNINWFNLREMHIKPLLVAGHQVTVLTDDAPTKEQELLSVETIVLNQSKTTSKVIFKYLSQMMKLLANFKIFNRKERRRVKFIFNKSLKYVEQIENNINNKFDIIHCHFLTRPVCIGIYESEIDTPIVSTIHGSDIYISPQNTQCDLDYVRLAFERSTRVIIPGSSEAEEVVRWGGDRNKLAEIPWGVSSNNFYPLHSNLEQNELKEKWNVKNKKILISVRNLKEIYNISSVLKAYGKLDGFENIMLFIAGDGELKAELRQEVDELGLSNIRFIGRVNHSELRELYQLSDLYIQNPLSDALPYSILECIACGTPVVAGEIGSIGDIKRLFVEANYHDSIFLSHGVLNSDNLANLITQGMEQGRKFFGSDKAYVCFIQQHFSIESNVNSVEDVYLSVIGNQLCSL